MMLIKINDKNTMYHLLGRENNIQMASIGFSSISYIS